MNSSLSRRLFGPFEAIWSFLFLEIFTWKFFSFSYNLQSKYLENFFMRNIRKNQEYVRSGIPRAGKCGKRGHVFLLVAFSFVFCCYVRKELIGTGDV